MKWFKRISAAAAVMMIASGSVLAQAYDAVVFIHGKGGPSMANVANAEAYWGDLVRAATDDYNPKMNHFVAHYDGTASLMDATMVVSKQIAGFIKQSNVKPNRMKIYAHSFGGLVAQHIFSNQGFHPHFNAIIEATGTVTTIATPHLGSEAADTMLRWSKEGNGAQKYLIIHAMEDNPATRELTTTKMQARKQSCSLFGFEGCPALPKTFYNISGGSKGVINDFFWEGHREDLALSLIASVVEFPGASDGLVASYSAQGLDVKVLKESKANHHHLRNNDYVTMGDYMRKEIF